MQKTIRIILILFIVPLTSLTSNKDSEGSSFQTKVDSFIEKYACDFITISENFYSEGNDYILDKKVVTRWSKTITLKSKTSFKNHYNQTIYQRIFLGFYEYETEKLCSAAKDSLLTCLGNDCEKLSWGDSGKSLKTPPFNYLINEKEIIVCKISCEHKNDFWTTFKHDMNLTFGNGASGIIEAECGGPVNFRKF